jgi:3D (Asp-Asp-Asp) domain-containing protein
MDIKKVMATFILTGLIFTGSNYYHMQEKEDEIEQLKVEQGLRDSEIAKLEDDVKSKIESIEEVGSKLSEVLTEAEKIKSENSKLKAQNKELQNKNKELQNQVNFKKETKGVDEGGRKLNVEMTAYIAQCSEGCTGITATGIDIRGITTYQGHRIVATDPDVIPLHSIMKVDVNGESFTAISLDTGGAIDGHIVDYLVGSTSQAYDFGRQNATITILREGK